MPTEMVAGTLEPEVGDLRGFPKSGDHRIFIGIKDTGQVEIGAIEAHIQPARRNL
ncbi:MAG: hypothetical protein WCE61_20070 [Candidatus Acidiferrum sp.]